MIYQDKGAEFSTCGKYRYALWRVWDNKKSNAMFIGLNPSTANADTDDATIRRVVAIAAAQGYGGVYMMNCFPYISTDPKKLYTCSGTIINDDWILEVSRKCKDIFFAWGNFEIVRKLGVDFILSNRFPNALALQINKNGSPKHPLYVRTDVTPVKYKQ